MTPRALLFLSALVTLILWQFPWGQMALYPFTLLATYAHEMGHGLTALLLGGRFHSLELWPNGAGRALHAIGSDVAAGLVAAGGLIGPSVAGATLLYFGRRPSWARGMLFVLGLLMGLTVVLYAQGSFTQSFVGITAAILVLVAWVAPASVQLFALQFLSLQLCIAVFKDLDYMFSEVAFVGGAPMPSDSARIQEVFLLPYWFWGGAAALFSFTVLGFSLKGALRSEPAPAQNQRASGRRKRS